MKLNPIATALLCAISAVHAEEAETMSPVVVTASRIAETADSTLAPVAVITREDIERSQAPTMVELLQTQTGIDVARTGGPGGDTSVFMRGTNSDHVLVLVDGVRVSSATTGSFAWTNLDPAQIERIEIVRGPRSTLYGSDAIGGVIQIFTRKASGPTARVQAGSYGTYGLEAGYGGGETVRYHVLASANDSEGFNATNSKAFATNPDKDGYRNRSLSAGIEAPVGSAKLEVNGWHSEGHINYDNGVQNTVNQSLDARVSGEVRNGWIQSLRIGNAVDDLDDQSSFPARIITARNTADWQHTFQVASNQLVIAGLDWAQERGENRDTSSDAVLFDHTLAHRGAYLTYSTQLGLADLQGGLRRDDYDTFGEHTTGQAAVGYDLNERTRLLASYGTAFKAPNFNNLYFPGYGNPALKPEESRTSEVGLRYRIGARQHVAVNLFQTDIRDLIQAVEVIPTSAYEAHNVGKARIRGLETEYRIASDEWDFGAHLTLQEPRDVDTDKPLARRPDKKLSLVTTRKFENRGSMQAEWVLVGDRRDANGEMLPGYGLLNIAAIHPLSRSLRLEGRIDNLLDQDYTLATGFNTPGRFVLVSLAYRQ